MRRSLRRIHLAESQSDLRYEVELWLQPTREAGGGKNLDPFADEEVIASINPRSGWQHVAWGDASPDESGLAPPPGFMLPPAPRVGLW